MEPFAGTDRYRPVRALGEGGMGQVWEVEDTTAGRRVALKTLHAADPFALYLFKNEFRALADVAHPHLVGLFDLGMAADRPFFTMELVDGAVDLLRYFRGNAHSSGRSWLTAGGDLDPDATMPPQILDELEDVPDTELPAPSPMDTEKLARLPAVLGELAEALATLHAARKLHRDIKPSNVLVTPDGRVVLVDFGLVASLEPEAIAHKGMIAGSVPYMSPEQSLGAELTPASDWYAFGAVLYELLTGRPPFAGARGAVLAAKRGREVVPPSLVVPGVPEDLDRLCVGLLALDPDARPTGSHVLKALGRAVPHRRDEVGALVGRETHLGRLRAALDAAREGREAIVHVAGHSGMGKTALTGAFLDEVRVDPDVLVLASRCYERDHVPFKAIDPLVDALVPWLAALPRDEVAALAPRYIRSLARLFPVLDRIEAFVEAGSRIAPAADPHEEQRRAFDALRELFARVGDRRLLVVAIDDLQWADRDSAEVLRGLLRPPDQPAMLLLLAFRSEAVDSSLALRWLPQPTDERVIEVGGLTEETAAELVRGIHPGAAPPVVERVVDEAAGSPFFLTELAYRAREVPDEALDLDALIRGRVSDLPASAVRLLEVVALASVPIPRSVAFEAAADAGPAELSALQAGRLVRSEGPAATDNLECYHDRIREPVVADLADAGALHLALAEALEGSRNADPELLRVHFARAGDTRRAQRYAREAADVAMDALAFDRAADNLRALLELLGPDHAERGVVLERLGEALNNAGRGVEAAEARLAAAPLLRKPVLRQQAVVNYLMSGANRRAEALLWDVLGEAGIPLARSFWARLPGYALRRLWARLSGVGFRPGRRATPTRLARAEAMFELAIGHMMAEQRIAFPLLARFVVEAKRLGDPRIHVLAMAAETLLAHIEPGNHARCEAAYQEGKRLLASLDAPRAGMLLHYCHGVAAIQRGEALVGEATLEKAASLLPQVADAAAFRGWIERFHGSFIGYHLDGGFHRHTEIFYRVMADAEARNDLALQALTLLGQMGHHPKLYRDADPDAAEAHFERFFAQWQQERFDMIHLQMHICRFVVYNARGEWDRSWRLFQEVEDDMRAAGALTGALQNQMATLQTAVTTGAYLAGHATRSDLLRARRVADREIRSTGWRGLTCLGSATALYAALGDLDKAEALADEGIRRTEASDFRIWSDLFRAYKLRLHGRDASDPELAAILQKPWSEGWADPMILFRIFAPVRQDMEDQ